MLLENLLGMISVSYTHLAGMGASLQHYNPLIDDEVRKVWNLSDDWKLIAQMPFGVPVAQPGSKEVMSLDERVFEFTD